MPIHAGEITQRFISFLMRQAQQAALCLGQIPHPHTGKTEVHLEIAKIYLEDLEMLHEKTRGNLSSEEEQIFTGILNDLRVAYRHTEQQLTATESTSPGN